MPLKFKYQSKEQVPAEHAAFYVERDGAFVLDAEGAVDKSRVDEFRTNNVTLKNQTSGVHFMSGLERFRLREVPANRGFPR